MNFVFGENFFEKSFPRAPFKKLYTGVVTKYVQIFRDCLDLPGKKRGMDYDYPILPEEKGKFFVLNFMDREIGQLIGTAVKEEDAPVLTKPVKKVK